MDAGPDLDAPRAPPALPAPGGAGRAYEPAAAQPAAAGALQPRAEAASVTSSVFRPQEEVMRKLRAGGAALEEGAGAAWARALAASASRAIPAGGGAGRLLVSPAGPAQKEEAGAGAGDEACAAAPAAAEARGWRVASLLCVLAITLLGDSARGLYVRRLGGDERALGFTVAAFSAGRLVFSPALGAAADRRSFAFALRLALALMAAGNLLYVLVPQLHVMVAARLLVGCGASTLGVSRAYVVALAPAEQRTAYLAYLSAVQFAGAVVMPGLGALLSALPPAGAGPLRIDAATAPAWLLALAAAALAALTARHFDEPPHPAGGPGPGGPAPEAAASIWEGIPVYPLLVCGAVNLVVRGVMAVIETIGTVITSRYFRLGPMGSGLLFGAIGVLALAVFLSMRWLAGRFGEARLAQAGLACTALGLTALAALDAVPSLPLFGAALALVWALGHPLGQTALLSIFSGLLGPRKQGQWMGWFTSSGALARIAFASASGLALPALGLPPLALGTAALVLAASCAALCLHARFEAASGSPGANGGPRPSRAASPV
eukprot:tig00020995_g16912.t1